MIKIAINGFGRIGRAAFKIALEKKNFQVVAINDLTGPETLAHLLKYDSVYKKYDKNVTYTKDSIKIGSKKYKVYSEREPANLPWKKLGVDVVIECTGVFTTMEKAQAHVNEAGAKAVVISAPGKSEDIKTFVLGVNENKLGKEKVISNASCTTNCIAPVIRILNDNFGVKKALMTTIHAYTAGQNLVDGPNKDLRRGRAAALNIVPTTTGAAIATTKTLPVLKNKFDGISVRVPVPVGSLSDITALLKKKVTVKQINDTFIKATKHPFYKNILNVTDEPLVSSDFIGSPYSAIVDLSFTKVVDGDLIKVVAWYDNEWGYSVRLVEMVEALSKRHK